MLKTYSIVDWGAHDQRIHLRLNFVYFLLFVLSLGEVNDEKIILNDQNLFVIKIFIKIINYYMYNL